MSLRGLFLQFPINEISPWIVQDPILSPNLYASKDCKLKKGKTFFGWLLP
jgi:hypothetical protein